jgi:hypothetical protein
MIKAKYNINKYVIIGISAIAFGTLLMTGLIKDPKLVVLGVIINAIGLFVMTVGSLISSKKDKSEIIEKISGFREEISTVKSSIASRESLHDVEKIENEFNEWAESFVGNFESKAIERQKNEILLKETEINLSKKWRHVYQYVFEVIRQMLEAYNQKAKNKIEFKVPELPINLYGEEANSFKSFIVFDENTVWTIKLSPVRPHDRKENIPSIDISFFLGDSARKDAQSRTGFNCIILFINPKEESIGLQKIFLTNLIGDVKNSYSISANEYKASIRELFTTLIEYELVKLKN